LEFQPLGRRIDVPPGTSLLEAAREAGVDLVAICGGAGLCDTCRVRVAAGGVTPPTGHEEEVLPADARRAGWRLACQARVRDEATIDVPRESLTAGQRLQVEGAVLGVKVEPRVRVVDVSVAVPTMDDPRADATRLTAALGATGVGPVHIPAPLLRSLPARLRALGWTARAVTRGRDLVALLPTIRASTLGLAVDVGTTKLAAYLVDLESGETLASTGRMNPQIAWGEDVISRIAWAGRSPANAAELQAELVAALNAMIAEMATATSMRAEWVVDVVLVGNTAMHHLAARLPVEQLGAAPYVPVVSEALEIPAADLGLAVAPGAMVYLPPIIAGYVGADHVAVLIAARAAAADDTLLVVDVGTNTEISLACGGRLIACSCASGPAFEGAHVSGGMRAAPGAIERLRVRDGVVHAKTIADAPAVGLCGSGILDAVAAMAGLGVLDRHGSFRDHPLVRRHDRVAEFLVVPAERSGHGRDVVVTRADVNEIQLAKAAIRAGIDVLIAEAGTTPARVDRVVLAGAFGTYVDVASALAIGMFPPIPIDRFSQVGNAAGAGARELLVSGRVRQEASHVAERVEYVELTGRPAFADAFARALGFTAS
jgi:uncharacterized 2Fe-2S/4Fe-4S cluster protein (DUF4445 family)